MTTVSFNQLSDWGLLYEINKVVLHPLGLALSRDPNTGESLGAYIDPSKDLEWEYDSSLTLKEESKVKYFLENRKEILTKLNKG